jgi:two-component system chemotaxis sensor kinase CheA
MAIIDGLLVKVSENAYVFPLAAVEECIEMDGGAAAQWEGGRRLINVRGSMIPYISLRSCFGHDGGEPEREHVVVVGLDDERVGFVVDAIVGKHQTVIKSMNSIYRNVAAFSGATILGDASVALILDVRKLYEVEQLAEAGMVASQRE